MNGKNPTNVPASVKARLLNRARTDAVDFNHYLIRYANERLLYRLSISPYASEFVLKGAMLFVAWSDLQLRPTRDLDLLGFGEDSIERFKRIFRNLADMSMEDDDGLTFDSASVRATPIRDEQEYHGKRVTMNAHLGSIPIKLQIDIGIGDIITPQPESLEFPSLLDMPQATLRASTRETVVAEKFHVMVTRDLLNSRLKDYFDIWILAKTFTFDAAQLKAALTATFERRRTVLPAVLPTALTERYAQEPARRPAWKRITQKTQAGGVSLADAITTIASFLEPIITVTEPVKSWAPGGPWQS